MRVIANDDRVTASRAAAASEPRFPIRSAPPAHAQPRHVRLHPPGSSGGNAAGPERRRSELSLQHLRDRRGERPTASGKQLHGTRTRSVEKPFRSRRLRNTGTSLAIRRALRRFRRHAGQRGDEEAARTTVHGRRTAMYATSSSPGRLHLWQLAVPARDSLVSPWADQSCATGCTSSLPPNFEHREAPRPGPYVGQSPMLLRVARLADDVDALRFPAACQGSRLRETAGESCR